MIKIIYIIIAVISGMFVSLHIAMNGRLSMTLKPGAGADFKSVASANMFFWVVGALTAVIYYILSFNGSPLPDFKAASKPLLIAGAIGASIVFVMSYLIPDRIGGAAAGFIYLMIGQVIMGLVLSHFGMLGSEVDPVTIKKIIGIFIIFGGVYLTVL